MFSTMQTVEDQFAKERESDWRRPDNGTPLVIDEIHHILFTTGEIDIFADLNIAFGAQQRQAAIAPVESPSGVNQSQRK